MTEAANAQQTRWQFVSIAIIFTVAQGLASAEEAVPAILPKLATLPVAIIPQALVLAGGGTTFEVVVYNRYGTGARWQTVGGEVFSANMASLITDDAYPVSSAFEMDIINWERSPTTKLRLVFEASTATCLVSNIDNRLVHTFSPGREIKVSSVYYKDATRLARATTVKTLCTAFNGQIAIHLGAPVSDMLPATIVTYDNTGAKAAVSMMNLDFPTYVW